MSDIKDERLGARREGRPIPPLDSRGDVSELSPCWWPLLWEHSDIRPTLQWLADTEDDADEAALEQRRGLVKTLWSHRIVGLLADEESVFFEDAQTRGSSDLRDQLITHEDTHREISVAVQLIEISAIDKLLPLIRSFATTLMAHQDEEQHLFWPQLDAILSTDDATRLGLRLEQRRTREGRGSPRDARAVREAMGRNEPADSE